MNKTGTTQNIFIDLYSARIGFESTVIAGNITVRGIGNIYLDDSTNTTFNTLGLISQPTIADAVWDELLSLHTTTGSAGYALENVSAGASPDLIAAAVWNAQLSVHTDSGSAGEILSNSETQLKNILGLSQENFRIIDQTYGLNNELLSATIKLYNNADDCSADINSFSEYQMTSLYEGSNLIDYKVTKIQ